MLIQVIDTKDNFKINILKEGKRSIIFSCGYYGGQFDYENHTYIVRTPYHGEHKVSLYKITKIDAPIQEIDFQP